MHLGLSTFLLLTKESQADTGKHYSSIHLTDWG